MKVRKYLPSDFKTIEAWGKLKGDSYQEDLFPPLGFIVEDYAAYFIYETKSKVCFLENLIGNPESDKNERSKAIDLLINALFNEARQLGYQIAYACTDNPAVITRALNHNVEVQTKYVLLTKNLSQ